MKITFVLPTVNMSGGMRVVAIYASLLANRGHRVVLVSPPQQGHRLSLKRRLRQLIALRRPAALGAKSHLDGLDLDHRTLEKWRPIADHDVPDGDVVIATWWETAEWVAALSPDKGSKVYLIQHHEVFPWLAHERSRATYRLPLHKIVVARWLSLVMAEEYGDEAVEVVHNSVDHAQFFAEPRDKQTRPTVGFLYSSVPFKGVDVTLRAIQQLRESLPNLRVRAFGNERLPAVLTDQIEFSFDPPQDKLRDIYAGCDVWLTASRSEGFNLPAMEAMACRTPVVSTRTGWPEEAIVDGVNGACVAIDDADALARHAKQFLELPPAQWRLASEAAFRTVADSSWEKSVDLFEQVLLGVAVSRAACEPEVTT